MAPGGGDNGGNNDGGSGTATSSAKGLAAEGAIAFTNIFVNGSSGPEPTGSFDPDAPMPTGSFDPNAPMPTGSFDPNAPMPTEFKSGDVPQGTGAPSGTFQASGPMPTDGGSSPGGNSYNPYASFFNPETMLYGERVPINNVDYMGWFGISMMMGMMGSSFYSNSRQLLTL